MGTSGVYRRARPNAALAIGAAEGRTMKRMRESVKRGELVAAAREALRLSFLAEAGPWKHDGQGVFVLNDDGEAVLEMRGWGGSQVERKRA